MDNLNAEAELNIALWREPWVLTAIIIIKKKSHQNMISQGKRVV